MGSASKTSGMPGTTLREARPTHIFHPTSACFFFFSYCESTAKLSCLTIFA